MVRVEGLEPPRLAALEPKSSVSTNFTTPASWFSFYGEETLLPAIFFFIDHALYIGCLKVARGLHRCFAKIVMKNRSIRGFKVFL